MQITFNHISKDLSEETVEELKRMYVYYHKLSTCYKWKYKKLRKIKLALSMSGTVLIVTGTIVGYMTFNPVILGIIGGGGVLIKDFVSNSGLPNKVEHCKFAYTNYQKIMVQLKTFLRGMPYDAEIFLSDAKVIEDIVIDMCPPIGLAGGVAKRYDKTYGKL